MLFLGRVLVSSSRTAVGFLGLSVTLVLNRDSWAVVSPCLSPQGSCLAEVNCLISFLCQGRGFSQEARVTFRMALILALQKPGMVVQSCNPS